MSELSSCLETLILLVTELYWYVFMLKSSCSNPMSKEEQLSSTCPPGMTYFAVTPAVPSFASPTLYTVFNFDTHFIYIATALTPEPVRNLTATVDAHVPSVALNWDPPANAAHAGDVTKYEIHFQDNDSSFHGEEVVNGSTTTTIITRESGLRPLTTFTFNVRACSRGDVGNDVGGEWRAVSTFVGK